jgi:hypothetical protein
VARQPRVLERHQVVDRGLEAVKRRAARIGFITHHQSGPLPGAHAGGAGIGQQVDQHIVRVQQKQVVVGLPDELLAFVAGGHADRLYGLDPERLDDGFHGGITRNGAARALLPTEQPILP